MKFDPDHITPEQQKRGIAALYPADPFENDWHDLAKARQDMAEAHRAEVARLRDALTEANQENEILRGELQSARNSQPAIDWLGREM